METEVIIELTISIFSAFAVLGTLSFTVYFQIKNNKDNKNLDIARLLDYAYDKYRNFEYCPKKSTSDETIIQRFIDHYITYLFEIDILLSRYKISGNIHCMICNKKEKFNDWIEKLNKLKPGEQWNWNLTSKIFYDITNKELTVMFCPECAKEKNISNN